MTECKYPDCDCHFEYQEEGIGPCPMNRIPNMVYEFTSWSKWLNSDKKEDTEK